MFTSLVDTFLQQNSHLRVQTYFKASLTALSHAMEDWVFAATEPVLIVANFQQERFYRQEAGRYQRLAQRQRVYALCAAETQFTATDPVTERPEWVIPFSPDDPLVDEWHLVILGPSHASCLICRERRDLTVTDALDSARAFEGIWSRDRATTITAAQLILDRVAAYRPDLTAEIEGVRQEYCRTEAPPATGSDGRATTTSQPFVERLITHLQASQYKLLNAYRSLAAKERQERFLATAAAAIRRSLDPQQVLQTAAEQLGAHLQADRALGYRYRDDAATAIVAGEFRRQPTISSLKGEAWLPWNGPLGSHLLQKQVPLSDDAPEGDALIQGFASALQDAAVVRWLLVPITARDRLLGAIELHRCQSDAPPWTAEAVAAVAAVADQVGVALTQAEAYTRLEDLNEQLAALDRTRSNLVAIAGHELRTPLSTIQVCLESLASEPDMSAELRQVMLNTALIDAERMRRLIRDFLTLSQFESGRVDWNPEAVSLQECIDLSLSNLRARWRGETLPEIVTPTEYLEPILPLVRVDGEWLVEVLAKLLDNACKFTAAEGRIAIEVDLEGSNGAIVSVVDTGRGVEPSDLERIFERFYQEEGALQRTRNGTGLGLAICRQVVERWGGRIWAESAGRNTGTRISFTVPSASRQLA